MDVARFSDSPVGHLVPLRGTDGRTGRQCDHVAFMPDPLADEPALSGATWRTVSRAAHALGRLHQAARQVPSPALLRRPTLRREAQSTSALEGTVTPLEDVLAAELIEESARSAELHEVLNYVGTADAAFGWLDEGRRVTVGMLCDLQSLLVSGTPADNDQSGRVRQIPVVIGSRTDSIVDARFVPAPPGPALEAGLQDLVDWINSRSTSHRDPIVAAALGHYQFESLHPFNDGNGRLGRLLIVLQLLQDGILTDPLLSVSPWFEAHRLEYQDRLAAVSAVGDWDGWVSFFSAGLYASATDTAQRVHALLDIQADYLERLRTTGTTGIVRDIAESLIAYPYVTVSAISEHTGKTFQAANNAVRKLVQLGILRERTGRKQWRFFEANEVVAILTGPVTP
jgi:Fic family protein